MIFMEKKTWTIFSLILLHLFPIISYFIFNEISLYEQNNYLLVYPYVQAGLLFVYGALYLGTRMLLSWTIDSAKPSQVIRSAVMLLVCIVLNAAYLLGYFYLPGLITSRYYLHAPFAMFLLLIPFWTIEWIRRIYLLYRKNNDV